MHHEVESPLVGPAETAPPERKPIPQLRAEARVGAFFTGDIETPEQFDAAVQALRDECERLIGEGKKVWVQG